MMLIRVVALGLTIGLISACGNRRVEVQPPPATPEHVLLFEAGLAAFREATPEGYERAAEAFRKAEALEPMRCEYSLHRAQAVMFLTQERKLNWEEFDPLRTEAATLLDAAELAPACAPMEALIRRLRAITWSTDYRSSGPLAALVQFQRLDRANDPIAAINRAVELDPNDPMNWIVLWQINPLDSKMPALRAVELAPDLPLAQYEIGRMHMIVSNYAAAKEAYERTLELNPHHFRSVIGLAHALGSVDPSADVQPLYKRAIEIAPNFLEARTLFGSYFAGMEENEQAIEQFQAAIATNPRHDPAHLALGSTLLRTGDMARAESAFLKVIELRPSTVEAHYYLGNIELARGNLAQAKSRYEQAIRYRRNFAEALYGLGAVASREGNVDEALRMYDGAIGAKSDFADAYVARAEIRMNRQQLPEAITDLDQAIRIYDRQIANHSREAQAAEARGWLRKALFEHQERARVEGNVLQVRELRSRATEN